MERGLLALLDWLLFIGSFGSMFLFFTRHGRMVCAVGVGIVWWWSVSGVAVEDSRAGVYHWSHVTLTVCDLSAPGLNDGQGDAGLDPGAPVLCNRSH